MIIVGGRAMTRARIYQHGIKACLEAKPLGGNPYDPSVNSEEHEAWNDGWLDANHARWRRHSLEIAALQFVKAWLLRGDQFA